MYHWLIRLKGDKLDLENLKNIINSPSFKVFEEGEKYYLWCKELDETCKDAGEVNEKVNQEILAGINGTLRLLYPDGSRNVEENGVCVRDEDGTIKCFVFMGGSINIRTHSQISAILVKADGTIVSDADELHSLGTELTKLLRKDKECRKIVNLFISAVDNESFVQLYNVYDRIKGYGAPIYDWVNKSEIKRFKRTANNPDALGLEKARHGKSNQVPPDSSTTFEEAKILIHTILKNWLEEKIKSSPESDD